MTVYLLSQSRFKKNYKKIIFISGTVFNKEFVQNLKKINSRSKEKLFTRHLVKKFHKKNNQFVQSKKN